jgi:hypothetical protein
MARHPVPTGGGRLRDIEVVLSDDGEVEFEVQAEGMPDGLPGTFEGASIEWFSNFRLKKKPGRPKTNRKVSYTIEFEGASADRKYVYLDVDSGNPAELRTESAGNNRRRGTLTAEDPPIGHT